MNSIIIGKTANGLAIPLFSFGKSGPKVTLIGGVHGDEYEGIAACWTLIQRLSESCSYNLQIDIIPCLNLDGELLKQRKNANSVDLNRNLPTKDWTAHVAEEKYDPGKSANSEPENKALTEYLSTQKPQFILSLHSWKPCLNVNGDCEPEASILSELTGYEIKGNIGYPTPGCLGTYTGLERNIPTITYEIERGLEIEKIVDVHVNAILEALKKTQEVRK
jgi:protein MpaA